MNDDSTNRKKSLITPLAVMFLTAVLMSSACSSDGDSTGEGGDGCDDCGDVSRDREGGDDVGATDTPVSGRECHANDDCRGDQICDLSREYCVFPCDSAGDCSPAESCNIETGLCEDLPPCSEDSECGEAEACDVCLGVCVASEGGTYCLEDANCPDFDMFCDSCIQECRRALELCEECHEDRQCGSATDQCLTYTSGAQYCGVACGGGFPACATGATCSEEQGQCVALTGDCEARQTCGEDSDCSGVQICSEHGVCVDGCTGDLACPAENVCSGGHCVSPCTSNETCEGEEECDEEGHCMIPGGCATSRDCPEAETYCDRDIGLCVPGCENDHDCLSAGLQCEAGSCVNRPCRGAYACAYQQFCDFDTGECVDAEGQYCDDCDGEDLDSCGAENACLKLQDADGNEMGAFCMPACTDDPDNLCPKGWSCEELEITGGAGGTEIRNVCYRGCYRGPV